LSGFNRDPDGDGVNTFVNLRFPGQYHDFESGLYYNYYRYYDSLTGRYVTSDPIGLAGGINTYGYVGGNPTAAVDPDGLRPIGNSNSRTSSPYPRSRFGNPLGIPSLRPIGPRDAYRLRYPASTGGNSSVGIMSGFGTVASALAMSTMLSGDSATDAQQCYASSHSGKKNCKLELQRIGGKWPGIPEGRVQCTYKCKTDFGITKITRIQDGNSCAAEVDFVDGDHGFWGLYDYI